MTLYTENKSFTNWRWNRQIQTYLCQIQAELFVWPVWKQNNKFNSEFEIKNLIDQQVKCGIEPTDITFQPEFNCNILVPKLIFIIAGVILIHKSMNLKQEKTYF